jgi:hypothetical protein
VIRTTAAKYRRLTQGCLELARSASTEEVRLTLIGMASRWFQLAEAQADESVLVKEAVPTIPAESPQQAVAQQQQQVQPKDEDKEG